MVGLHASFNNYGQCGDYTPRVAFLLPAWNEADVLDSTIDSLMKLDYPAGTWRIYVIDDASTDATPQILRKKMDQYPGSVFHLRREVGGQGKAHTLNYGLRTVLKEDFAEAIMIMDADVLFEPRALRQMARHLANPKVGAITAYIKEGSYPGNAITRFIGFEYITAQAAIRRAQNVAGFMVCLAGGAQLHSRENIKDIGGEIDTSSMAEDTCTTLKTQLLGKRVIFEGNAVVWAEEPGSLVALWKQRLRWARGNLQLTVSFRSLWLNRRQHQKLGGIAFALVWFSTVLMPFYMLCGASGLLGLYFLYPHLAFSTFVFFWTLQAAIFLFETIFSFVIDPATARRVWIQGMLFPGIVSLVLMSLFFLPTEFQSLLNPLKNVNLTRPEHFILTWIIYGWGGIGILAAWILYRLEKVGLPNWIRDGLLLFIGYGPLLGAIAFAAIVAHCRGQEARWDKTVKSGKARMLS